MISLAMAEVGGGGVKKNTFQRIESSAMLAKWKEGWNQVGIQIYGQRRAASSFVCVCVCVLISG